MRHPSKMDNGPMTSVAYMVGRVVKRARPGARDLREAWAIAARWIGVSPGTVENIERGRLKHEDRYLSKAAAAFITVLEKEIADAQGELAAARQTADRMDAPSVIAARASLAARIEEAQQLISRGVAQ